ncbi:hypothetical protein PVAND_013236 [Polypedilum vanderplanki]|uniref:Uncharacterized protein n=1 Tax=Polypedilum vanderplanki TaxID=319348 RepID=A0A9J6CPS0_POLVA|nr:hypothetical protein PVAND_013236 [Polypedilum vanderplanki]
MSISIKIINIFIIFSFLINLNHSINFECQYGYFRWATKVDDKIIPIFKNQYSCVANITGVIAYNTVTEVSNNHLDGRSSSNVIVLKIFKQSLKKFPENVEEFFPYLKAIFINQCKLKSIAKNDLRPFERLQFVSFTGNNIKNVNSDVFQYNPMITFVGLGSNPIEHIGAKFFDHLKSLKTIILSNNTCIDEKAIRNNEHLSQLKLDVAEKCPPTKEMLEYDKNGTKKRQFFRRALGLEFLDDEESSAIESGL